MMMVQQALHGHVTLVHGVQMPAPAAKLPSADANRFLMQVQGSACRLIAGVAIGDDGAVFRQPFRHHWSDVRRCCRREHFRVGRSAARDGRQDRPLLQTQASASAMASPLSRKPTLLQRPVPLAALQKIGLVHLHDAFQAGPLPLLVKKPVSPQEGRSIRDPTTLRRLMQRQPIPQTLLKNGPFGLVLQSGKTFDLSMRRHSVVKVNLRHLYGLAQIPCDTPLLRRRLDPISPVWYQRTF